MANRLRKPNGGQECIFPPEADGDFETVPTKDIAAWREKLNERFEFGKGKFVAIEEPTA